MLLEPIFVRYAAKTGFSASPDKKVVINAGKPIVVTYTAMGGTIQEVYTTKYAWHTTAQSITNITRDAATFNGWYNGGKEYDFNTKLESNIELIARWITDETEIDEDETTILDDGNKVKIQVKGDENEEDKVKASGLEEIALDVREKNPGTDVKVLLEAKSTDEAIDNAAFTLISGESEEEEIEYLDITLTQIVSNGAVTTTAITEASVVVEILLPFNTIGKDNIKVYRYHNNQVDEFTQSTDKTDKTYYVVGNVIHIFTSKFSIYGIGYDNVSFLRRYGSPFYKVTVEAGENGTASVPASTAIVGSDVEITINPDSGFALGLIKVAGTDGKALALTPVVLGEKYTFRMPGYDVKVTVTFADNSSLNPFVDVNVGDDFYDAVMWAFTNGITLGEDPTHFAPMGVITRADMVAFLWRASGSPVVEGEIPFVDVEKDAYYEEAVRWAVSKGIIKGTSETTFEPWLGATKAEATAVLARFSGVMDEANRYNNRYNDVTSSDFFNNAAAWVDAFEGADTTAENFEPESGMKRSKFIKLLYKMFKQTKADSAAV